MEHGGTHAASSVVPGVIRNPVDSSGCWVSSQFESLYATSPSPFGPGGYQKPPSSLSFSYLVHFYLPGLFIELRALKLQRFR